MSAINKNTITTLPELAAQFWKGQGKTSGATTGKSIDLIDTNIPAIVESMEAGFRDFALSTYIWKEANYGHLEGDQLEYLSNGWIGRNHYNSAGAPAKPTPFAHPQQVRTAEEYKLQNIEMNLMLLSFEDVQELLTVDSTNEKRTKAELIALIHSVTDKLWAAEKQAVYDVMLEKEEEAKAKYQALYNAGFESITNANGSYYADIDATKIKEALPVLPTSGFILTDNLFDAVTMRIKVIFKDAQTSETKSDI